MSEEGGSINKNADLSSGEEEVTPTVPELVPEPEGEILSPITEEGRIDVAATEEAIREEGEPTGTSTVEQPQLVLETKPKKHTTKTTIMRIERSLGDASKQIEKQTTQINKINQNLQFLQKQMRLGERQAEIVNQIRSRVSQIQKQTSQVQKTLQKRPSGVIQSGVAINKNKNKKKKYKKR
jgi:hypothetical protein